MSGLSARQYVFLSLMLILLIFWLFLALDHHKPELALSGQAMGTVWEIKVAGGQRPSAAQLQTICQDFFKTSEQRLSYFLPGSEISRLNEKAGKSPVTLSPAAFDLIKQAKNYGHLTKGAFDLTVAPLLRLWGFYRGQGRRPEPDKIQEILGLIGYQKVELAEPQRTVFLPQPGMAVDLGGIAKGWAVDELVKILRQNGIREALVDLGGNIYGLGRPNGWQVGVKDPRDKTRILAVLKLRDQAVATSGDYERYFTIAERRYCHIFDPRTGWPVANGVASVTVVAPTGLQADALSTSLFVLGPDQGLDLIKRWPGVAALFVLESETGQRRYYFNPNWARLAENYFGK